MSKLKTRRNDELWNLLSAVADGYGEMSNEEFLAELKEEGSSVQTIAAHAREVASKAIKQHKQVALRAARAEYEASVKRIRSAKPSLPKTALQRKSLLHSILKTRPELEKGLLTAQHRNLEELADQDVQSALEQLALLGAWDGKIPEDPKQ